MPQTRRDFIRTAAAGVSLSFFAPSLFTRSAFGAGFPQGKILVILQLAGGNDAVNTFIPYTDARYRSARPTLGIPDSQILKVDSRIGFHPSMAKLQPLYDSGRFTFITNVGFDSLDRSHFRCEDVWQTGEDSYGQTQRGVSGWLGRYADTYLTGVGSPVTTVSIGSRNALGLSAERVIPAAFNDTATFDIQTSPRFPGDAASWDAALRGIYETQTFDGDLEAIRQQGTGTFGAVDLVATLPPASATVTYPTSNLGRGFQLAARVIAGEVGTHALWISQGGFDTHATQPQTHANLLTDVSDSLAAFYDDLAQRGLSNRVLVLAWSEFGRRVQENASLGTDHGKAGTVFLLGDGVKGGTFYGDVPNLSSLDDGDLPTQIDFRSVYWTVIQDFYGKDPEPVLNARYTNLGFLEREVSRRRAIR